MLLPIGMALHLHFYNAFPFFRSVHRVAETPVRPHQILYPQAFSSVLSALHPDIPVKYPPRPHTPDGSIVCRSVHSSSAAGIRPFSQSYRFDASAALFRSFPCVPKYFCPLPPAGILAAADTQPRRSRAPPRRGSPEPQRRASRPLMYPGYFLIKLLQSAVPSEFVCK